MHRCVNKNIVDVIVGEMFFHPDDLNKEITKEQALAIFEDMSAEEETAEDSDLTMDHYPIVIKNPVQFNLVIGFVSRRTQF